MILRRFGKSYESVEPDFSQKALTEVNFRRAGDVSIAADELDSEYERMGTRELTAQAEGDEKSFVEQALLDDLLAQLRAAEAESGVDAVLVENQSGQDYPKTRDKTTNHVVGGVNRLHFTYTVDPPLKLALLRRR